MTTTGGENTHVIALNGNFDDAQSGVKALFSSEDFHQQVNARGKVLSSANSSMVSIEIGVSDKLAEIQTILNEEHTMIMTREISVDEGIEEMNERVAELYE